MKAFFNSIYNLFKRVREAYVTESVFLVLTFFVLLFIMGSTVFYCVVEKISVVESFFYSVIVMTTLGATDFVPKTAPGKIFTACYSLMGTALFIGLITGLAQAIVIKEHRLEKK
ncbi:ion channel [Paenibacillus sambharensis]|nr:potassium channel family protein [Paenibacillus sambharensis]